MRTTVPRHRRHHHRRTTTTFVGIINITFLLFHFILTISSVHSVDASSTNRKDELRKEIQAEKKHEAELKLELKKELKVEKKELKAEKKEIKAEKKQHDEELQVEVKKEQKAEQQAAAEKKKRKKYEETTTTPAVVIVIVDEPISTTTMPTLTPTIAPTRVPFTPVPTTSVPTGSPTEYPTTLSPTTMIPTSGPTISTSSPTTIQPTPIPTSSPTSTPTTSMPSDYPSDFPSDFPSDYPSEYPTASPSTVPSMEPTIFVLSPAPSIDLIAASSSNDTSLMRSLVEHRCSEIITSITNDPKSLAVYWATPSINTTLYYSAPEGNVNTTIEGFVPDDYLLDELIPNRIIKANNATSIDVAGMTCSMNLEIELEETEDSSSSTIIISRSILELDEMGYLVTWMNAFHHVDDAAADADATTALACTAAFEAMFPPLIGITLTSLMSASTLFVPNTATLAFPVGNPNMTLTNMTSGWDAFKLFMSDLDPFDVPTVTLVTSPVDVTGSVCSFDQELHVTFMANPNCTTPLVVPGRVIMEIAPPPPPPLGGLGGLGAPPLVVAGPPMIARLLSLFDNTTFWGGIETCNADKAAMKAAATAKKMEAKAEQKEAAMAAKEQAKLEKTQKKLAAKAAKAKKKEDAKLAKQAKKVAAAEKKAAAKASKKKAEIDGGFLEDLFTNNNNNFGMSITAMLGMAFIASLIVSAMMSMTRSRARRFAGYDEIIDTEDEETSSLLAHPTLTV